MWLVEHTCRTSAENLALDEVLLDEAEQGPQPRELLRLWEPHEPLVVLGRSSRAADEVDVAWCEKRGISILRRTSGGAAIMTGPGCLMYAVIISYIGRPELRAIDEAHRFVMRTNMAAIRPLLDDVCFQGTCDLTWRGRKFSGNSLRCRREHLLYHGTLLYDFPVDMIADCLKSPPRQPDYRAGRDHRSFIANAPLDPIALRQSLCKAWNADETYDSWDRNLVAERVAEKYSQSEWNFRL